MIIPTIASTAAARSPARKAAVNTEAEPAANRALVPLERPISARPHHSVRPDASFVAHLIAMAEQTAQARALRRATPEDARVVYNRAAKARGADVYGRALSQVA